MSASIINKQDFDTKLLPSCRKKTTAVKPSDSSVRCRALHPSIVGSQLSAWFLNKSKTERWAAKSSRQLCLLCLISLKSPNKTSRRCRPRWIISREMSIRFKIRILNELTITANLKVCAHTNTRIKYTAASFQVSRRL